MTALRPAVKFSQLTALIPQACAGGRAGGRPPNFAGGVHAVRDTASDEYDANAMQAVLQR